jgi:hypothetical protein
MTMRSILLTIAATIGLTAVTMAQNVPNYVPTSGLVGWWPFNGNANDESGNGNNGIVNGATITQDRFGNSNKAYSFDGIGNYINCGNGSILNQFSTDVTIAAWIYAPSSVNTDKNILSKYGCNPGGWSLETSTANWALNFTGCGQNVTDNNTLYNDLWTFVVGLKENTQWKIFINGNLVSQNSGTPNYNLNSNFDLIFGVQNDNFNPSTYWIGSIDDIGIWNRALTQQEITELYNAVNCSNNTTITPQLNSLSTSSTASFTATTSDPNPSYVWQSDLGQGFQTLNNFGNYSGANSAILNISNVQLSEHNQPIRVITTSGNCIDTSNVAVINLLDTCILTIYDTLLTTVTDTLIINATITGINPPNNSNTIKVFPNPTNDHITIDYGNFSLMNGYQLQIENSLGQQVFQTGITQQSDYLNLTTWGGNGLYFVHIIDQQGNIIDIRKIVLQ